MLKKSDRPVFLKLPARADFVPLASSFVGHAARGLGLDREAAEELSLAAEEVVAYLTKIQTVDNDIEIRCFAGSHFIQVDLTLPVADLHLQVFNLTATVSIEDEAFSEDMGLLIASRMTDRFRISKRPGGNLELRLVKENVYPEIGAAPAADPAPVSRYSLAEPDPAQIKWFLRLVNGQYPATLFPRDFRYPGKVVDMASGNDCRVLLAVGPAGEIGGGMLWTTGSDRTVEVFGPYIFHPDSDPQMARDLLEHCISSAARTPALVLISRTPTPQLPPGYLEPLGSLHFAGPDGASEATACFRQMHEDTGSVVWAHPQLVGFLEEQYRRLVLPRDIQPVRAEGETKDPFSVLGVEMDRTLKRAVLRPVWAGEDRRENLAGHLRLLEKEGVDSVCFEMDLGASWQAEFTPALIALGFAPRIVLPYAGAGDLVVFERTAARS